MEKKQPSFRMELKNKDSEDALRRQEGMMIRQSLHEENLNPVSVGSQGLPLLRKTINPHNYRLYFDFDRTTFNPAQVGYELKNYNSEYHLNKLYAGCKVIIRKKTAEVTNLNFSDKYILVTAYTLEECDERLAQIVDYLDNQCIEALKAVLREAGGFSAFDFKRSPMQENGVKLDDYIDNIPYKLIYKDFPFTKKVYKEKTETYTIEKVRNYFRNRMIEDIAPQIAEEITELRKESNMLLWLKRNINDVDDIFKHRQDIIALKESDKKEIEEHLFRVKEVAR